MTLLFLPLQEKEKQNGKKKKKKGKKNSEKAATSKKDTSSQVHSQPVSKPLQPVELVTPVVSRPVSYDLFKGHSLQQKSQEPIPRSAPMENWFPMVTVFIVLLFSLVNVFYQKKFRDFLVSLLRYSPQASREDNIFTQRLRVLLFTIFSLIMASFIYQAASVYQLKPSKLSSFQFFSVILFIVFFAYLIKIGVVKLMGVILKTEKENQEYNNNILLYLNILTFGLFPLVILIGYTPQIPPENLVRTGWVFILSAILFRIGRGYFMAVSNPMLSKFYLFLYLCTLEILPLVVILKIFVGQLL